ncbi:MAG TPA: SurA N-terminal domain-containing protein [Xanthobacteraceae bacterium]|jgi:peptidyl-prolyl cis-trans isomerase D|nr:SurA N-terminal domain-containing protein [Xanthobacteraceae bacterium]
MLRGIRKASENWLGRIVMAAVMLLLAGIFGLWGINDIFTGFGRSTLAKIGNTEISIDQFQQVFRERLNQFSRDLGKPISAQEAGMLGLDRQVLGEMVAQAAMDQQAGKMGLGIPDAEIARHITSDPNLQGINGQFDRNKFEQILRSIGMTEQRFVAEQRQTALRRQIIDSFTGDLTAPKAWLDAINQFQNELRSVNYVVLGPAQAGDIPQPTDEQLSKYFEDRKIMFRAPEFRKIDIVAVTPTELAKWMEVSDDDIKAAYEKQKSRFTTPEKRHVQQIIFPTMADAQAAADRIKSGTSFATIAAERGLKEQDTDLGTVAKASIIDPAEADAAFALKEGEVSAPVQGRFGTFLVTVLKIEPSTTKTLADVSAELRSDLALERAKTQVQDLHDKIEDDRAGGATLEQAAEKLKLPIVSVNVDRSGRDPEGKPVATVPRASDVVNAAYASDVGVDNDPIDADGGYVWYTVADVAKAHDRTLDEVKAQVTQRWRDDEIASRLKAKADEMLGKLKGGEAFDTLAAADKLKIETATDIKRGGTSGAITPRMTEAIFQTPKDAYGSSVGDAPTQWLVFRVTDVKTPALDPNSPDAKSVAQRVQQQMADDLIGQYMAWLENYLGTNINGAALAQATGNSPNGPLGSN